jgi:hypothetical protein
MKTEALPKIANGKNHLLEIIQDIVEKADPEKIFLISASYHYRLTENIFGRNSISELQNSHYSLLILENQEKSLRSVKFLHSRNRMFSNQSDHQLYFMDIHDFNKKLEAGDDYAMEIVLNAMIWYDKGEIALCVPGSTLDVM